MANVVRLTFNPFQENTYLVFDQTKACLIVDPGCLDPAERDVLAAEIERRGLRPARLINTHCHLDHIFGNRYVADRYGLELEIPRGELPVLEAAPRAAMQYGLPVPEVGPEPGTWLEPGETLSFGETRLEIRSTPGHSPASVSFYDEAGGYVLAGDVLFKGSIGRTDLPGGDLATLLRAIREQLLTLPDEVVVYAGHGPPTTIGEERRHNPFLQPDFERRIAG